MKRLTNNTREGRKMNRRVEVNVLVNSGIYGVCRIRRRVPRRVQLAHQPTNSNAYRAAAYNRVDAI